MTAFARLRLAFATTMVLVAPVAAQDVCRAPGGPAADAGASVPSPADVLGYPLGERFTTPDDVVRYARALDEASDLVTLREYGRTPEGRPLVQLVIAKREHAARLDGILADVRRLQDPGLAAAEANSIASRTPAVVWFSYGVHGSFSAQV